MMDIHFMSLEHPSFLGGSCHLKHLVMTWTFTPNGALLLYTYLDVILALAMASLLILT